MLRCDVQAFVVCVISEPQCCRCRSTRFAGRFGGCRCPARVRSAEAPRARKMGQKCQEAQMHQQAPRNTKKRQTSGKETGRAKWLGTRVGQGSQRGKSACDVG